MSRSSPITESRISCSSSAVSDPPMAPRYAREGRKRWLPTFSSEDASAHLHLDPLLSVDDLVRRGADQALQLLAALAADHQLGLGRVVADLGGDRLGDRVNGRLVG